MKRDGKKVKLFYLRYIIVAFYYHLISFNKAKFNTIIIVFLCSNFYSSFHYYYYYH